MGLFLVFSKKIGDPYFDPPEATVSFSEGAIVGTRRLLEPAKVSGGNNVGGQRAFITSYSIAGGNQEGNFRLHETKGGVNPTGISGKLKYPWHNITHQSADFNVEMISLCYFANCFVYLYTENWNTNGGVSYVHLETLKSLDRETSSSYLLNISATSTSQSNDIFFSGTMFKKY